MKDTHPLQPAETHLSAHKPSGTAGSLRRWYWYGVIGVLVFNSFALLHRLLFPPSVINDLKILADINNVLGWLLAVFFCLSRIPRSWWRRKTRTTPATPLQIAQMKIPLWVGATFLVNAIERTAYLYYHIHHTEPPSNWPLIIQLLRYPFLLLAVLSLFRYTLPIISRLRLLLDGWLLLTSLTVFGWYFLLGPIILSNTQDALEKSVLLAYPLSDVILCFYVFQLSFRNRGPAFRVVRRLFMLGLLITILADIFDIAYITQGYSLLPLLQSLALCIGSIFIALTVQAVYNIPEASIDTSMEVQQGDNINPAGLSLSLFLWQSLMSLMLVLVILPFMVFLWVTGNTGPLALGVYIIGALVIAQIVSRQIFILYILFRSNETLQKMQKELQTRNDHLAEKSRELEIANEQQRLANTLKDQFLLNVNHELRTPLTEMHGYLELLHMSHKDLNLETRQHFLTNALHGSQELLRLVNSILEALHSEHAHKQLQKDHIPLLPVVQEVIDAFDPRTRKNYQLDLIIPVTLTIYADRQCLRQILMNLLSNAFKYSSPHTTITIGARHVLASQPTETGSEIYVWVKDQGSGIPPESTAFLFDKFFRLARHQAGAISGTGLGLSICKQLVEAMDGRIWVESSGIPKEGSRFCFMLPVPAST